MNPAATEVLSLCSVQTRERLASAFSGLRRVRPRVPFFRLAAHRIPTRWSLYRGLLRCLPKASSRYQRVYDVQATEWESRFHGQAVRLSSRFIFNCFPPSSIARTRDGVDAVKTLKRWRNFFFDGVFCSRFCGGYEGGFEKSGTSPAQRLVVDNWSTGTRRVGGRGFFLDEDLCY